MEERRVFETSDYITSTVATPEDSSSTSNGGDSALLSKLGGAFFGASGSPQRVVTNIRGFLANRITGALPETG